ncbi:MAG: hypothetical protein ABI887_18660 [Burkholderiales bacterium]
MQSRALVKERARRNLLLLIDGIKTDAMLLDGLAGISATDFDALQELGLIVPMGESPAGRSGRAATGGPAPAPAPAAAPVEPAAPAAPLDYAQFTAALTQMISAELGLRGFVLTLAVEKAGTIEELREVAERTIAQIGDRKGEARAAVARRTLYGR